jgi:predicted NBD/HSP70 family sugar kinase
MQLPPEDLDDQNFWLKYGLQLGHLFWVLTALFKLRQILLIGGLSQRHKDFLAEATEYVRSNLRNMPMPRIQLCQLGDNTGVYGAYWLATVMSRPDTLSKAQR